MYQDLSITELAGEIRRQSLLKQDYLATSNSLKFASGGDHSVLHLANVGEFEVAEYTHKQFADHLHIPRKYYTMLREEHPDLLDTNVNALLENDRDRKTHGYKRRMVRTLDGKARAFLSNSYRPLDNFDLVESLWPKLEQFDAAVGSCSLSDTKLYLKMRTPSVAGEVRVGDPVEMGVMISNSEVGNGSLAITPFVHRLVCSNGMIVPDNAFKKAHVTRALTQVGEAAAYLKDDTRQKADEALWLSARDALDAIFDDETFEQVLNNLRVAADVKIEASPVKAVEALANRYSLNEDESGGVLASLCESGDMTKYGLAQAVTATAEAKGGSYERATELERLGGNIITLEPREWEVLTAV